MHKQTHKQTHDVFLTRNTATTTTTNPPRSIPTTTTPQRNGCGNEPQQRRSALAYGTQTNKVGHETKIVIPRQLHDVMFCLVTCSVLFCYVLVCYRVLSYVIVTYGLSVPRPRL